MHKARRIIALLLALTMVASVAALVGCGGGATTTTTPTTSVVPFKTATDEIVALQAGNVDAAVNDGPVMQYLVKDKSKGLEIAFEAPTAELYGIAVSKQTPDLTKALNVGLAAVKASGEYNALYEKWFGAEPSKDVTPPVAAAKVTYTGKLVTPGTLTVGSDTSFPPFESLSGTTVEGFDVDLATAIAKEIGIQKVVFLTEGFDTLIPSLQAGKYDVIVSGMFITDERKQSVDFTDAYGVANQAVAVKAGAGIKDSTDLEGKKIGVQSGTTGESWVKENVK